MTVSKRQESPRRGLARGSLALLLCTVGACQSESGSTSGPSGELGAAHSTATVVYVDCAAPAGGSGASAATALRTVKEGVAAACALGGNPVVDVAPCAGDYHERGIVIDCPLTLTGHTVLELENGRPVAVRDDASLTRIVAADLVHTGSIPGPLAPISILRVLSSDVVIQRLQLVGGGFTLLGLLIDVGGFPGGAGCPSEGPLDGVVIRDVALSSAGQGIASANASLRVERVLSTDNLIGVTLFSGSPSISTRIQQSTLSRNGWYGVCAFPTELIFNPPCPRDAADLTPLSQSTMLIGNDLSDNGFANDAGGGVRFIALATSPLQAKVPGALDAFLANNRIVDNRAYGIVADFPILQVGRLGSSHDVTGMLVNNEIHGNGRNDVLATFTMANRTLDADGLIGAFGTVVPLVDHPEMYSLESSVTLTAYPAVGVDYDNPAELGGSPTALMHPGHFGHTVFANSLVVNGKSLVGTSVTPISN